MTVGYVCKFDLIDLVMAGEGLRDCNGTSKGDHFNHTAITSLYFMAFPIGILFLKL